MPVRILILFALVGMLPTHWARGDDLPPAASPYERIRYEASEDPGTLRFAVIHTAWIPPGVKTLRGVIVHQHGCGEGSCRSGPTGAFDLHWQALARKHDCAVVAPSYEQPEKDDCQLWCDPRNGSDATFQRFLADLTAQSGHPELATVPWALWGHSGGGHWAGGMLLTHPDRVVAAWLRSGVPLLEADPKRPQIKPHELPAAALAVPMMCNPGTKEGVTVKVGRFANVWAANETFFKAVRSQGGLIGVAVDPLTAHECGNQRYMAVADPESGLAAFVIERDGKRVATVPEKPVNPFGRPLFQGLQYSDTPVQPLATMTFTDTQAAADTPHAYRVIAVNTVGLESR